MKSRDALILLHLPLREHAFTNRNLTIHRKIAVYNAVVISTILYGCKSWVPYHRHIRLLESFHIRRFQIIVGLCLWSKVSHSVIGSGAGVPSIESMLLHRHLRWLGHVIRMPVDRLHHHVLYGKLTQDRWCVGGQKKHLTDHIMSILNKMQHSI